MEHCPPEIHAIFYGLACTDGGYTGRSLSLVSHYVHDTSKPFKLQSIFVTGVWQAVQFQSLLSNNPQAGIDHGVRHLFLSCLYPHDQVTNHVEDLTKSSQSKSHTDDTSSEGRWGALISRLSPTPAQLRRRAIETRRREAIHAAMKRRPPERQSMQCLLQDTFIQILSHVAPTLLTLSFSMPYDILRFGPPIHSKFLLLTELTISIPYQAYCAPYGSLRLAGTLHQLPALKRLNLAGIEVRVPILALFDAITVLAPCLSHLFLSTPKSDAQLAVESCLLAFGTLEKAGGTIANSGLILSALAGPVMTPASLERIYMQEGMGSAQWTELYKSIAAYEERFIFLPLDPAARQ